jgi:hypothetical protein
MKQVFTSSIRKRFEDPQLLTLGASNAVARDALETPAGREPGRTHHPACFLAASNMRGTLRGQAASHSTPGLSGIIGTYDQDTQIAAIKQCMTVTAPSNGCVCVCVASQRTRSLVWSTERIPRLSRNALRLPVSVACDQSKHPNIPVGNLYRFSKKYQLVLPAHRSRQVIAVVRRAEHRSTAKDNRESPRCRARMDAQHCMCSYNRA